MPSLPAPALSRPFLADDVDARGTPVTIETDAAERAALARLNRLPAVEAFEARLMVRREGTGVRVTGTVRATVDQVCVVTLDPFAVEIAEPVDVVFMDERGLASLQAARAKRGDPDGDEQEPDEPDAIINGRIDLGALAAEHLALGLDPYPKKPGAAFPEAAPADDRDASPFAALKVLKKDAE